jgi:DNA-binding PadR family transcriptional regulator
VFALTEAGRAYVEERRDQLVAPWDAVTEAVDEGVVELFETMKQVGLAVGQISQVAGEQQLAAARRLLAETRRSLYRILAEDEDEGGARDA